MIGFLFGLKLSSTHGLKINAERAHYYRCYFFFLLNVVLFMNESQMHRLCDGKARVRIIGAFPEKDQNIVIGPRPRGRGLIMRIFLCD